MRTTSEDVVYMCAGDHYLADCAMHRRDYTLAERHRLSALRNRARSETVMQQAMEILGLALTAAGLGQDEDALHLEEPSTRNGRSSAYPPLPSRSSRAWRARDLGAARARLGEPRANTAFDEGRAMTWDQPSSSRWEEVGQLTRALTSFPRAEDGTRRTRRTTTRDVHGDARQGCCPCRRSALQIQGYSVFIPTLDGLSVVRSDGTWMWSVRRGARSGSARRRCRGCGKRQGRQWRRTRTADLVARSMTARRFRRSSARCRAPARRQRAPPEPRRSRRRRRARSGARDLSRPRGRAWPRGGAGARGCSSGTSSAFPANAASSAGVTTPPTTSEPSALASTTPALDRLGVPR